MTSNKELNTAEYQEFRQFLEHQCGIVLGDNKLYLVKSRLSPLMSRFNIDSLAELVKRSMKISERALRSAVIDAMTTNETLWFRDSYPFEILANRIFDVYKNETKPLKIWSSACSSGQEPYSIAMTYLEYKARNPGALKGGIKITATDISNKVLEQCAKAEYVLLYLELRALPRRRSSQQFRLLTFGGGEIVLPSLPPIPQNRPAATSEELTSTQLEMVNPLSQKRPRLPPAFQAT